MTRSNHVSVGAKTQKARQSGYRGAQIDWGMQTKGLEPRAAFQSFG